MDQRGKRLLIIAALVILLFLGVTAYFIFFKKDATTGQAVTVGNNLFPFDRSSGTVQSLPTVNNSANGITGSDTAVATPIESRDRLRKVTAFPVSGFVSFLENTMRPELVINEKTQQEETIMRPITLHHIRYNDQRTGHIFDGLVSDTSILNRQLTKTTLPAAEELIFSNTGTAGYLRYEKNASIETFKILIPAPPTVPRYCDFADFGEDLKIGSKGIAVKNLQMYINTRFNQKIATDGSFGKGTSAWVKKIQNTLVVTESGSLDEPTRAAMTTDCTTIRETVAKAQNEPIELSGSLVSGYFSQVSKDRSNDLFMLRVVRGQTSGFWGTVDTSTQTQVFNSSFNEWMPQVVTKDFIGMTTYATGTNPGYFYRLNPSTKQFSKLLGPLIGLTTLVNPDGTWVLLTDTENGELVTKVVNLRTRAQKILPFTTLPEKCTWYTLDQFYCGVPKSYPEGLYPDDWYKGVAKFSDSLWSYDVAIGRATQVATPVDSIDMFRMEANPAAGYLFFMNKTTYELWSYRVGGAD